MENCTKNNNTFSGDVHVGIIEAIGTWVETKNIMVAKTLVNSDSDHSTPHHEFIKQNSPNSSWKYIG